VGTASDWLGSPGCIIEASAGTGKTTRLISEMVRAIRSGAQIDRIAAVTFTHQAAGEMKLRLRQELQLQIEDPQTPEPEREPVRTAIARLEEAFVGTIHAFCAHLLRQRPIEAGLDPAFREISAMESSILFAKVFRTWLEQRLRAGSPVLDAAFCRMAWRVEKGSDPVAELRREAWKLVEWRDFSAPWTRHSFERHQELDLLLDRLAGIVAQWKIETGDFRYLPGKLRGAAEFGERVTALRQTMLTDRHFCEAELCALARRRYDPGDFRCMHELQSRRHAEWMAFIAAVLPFQREADAAFASELHQELRAVVDRYGQVKAESGLVDFQDLLLHARDLLRRRSTREWFQRQLDNVFVDEFQDTDPIQTEILMLLACDDPAVENWREARPATGKLFLVGDSKQSIYRFRRAELSLYGLVASQLKSAGAWTEPLQQSLRSVQPIQEFVNAAFGHRMPDYLPLEGGRAALADQPGIVALPVPEVFGYRAEKKEVVQSSAPRAVAAFIKWLLDERKWSIQRDGTPAAISPSDICILFRRFTPDVTNPYVRSLECQEIPHVLIGSKSLHGREEVMTLCAALRAIEDPHDELNLYATLRGSLFAIDDATLYAFKRRNGSTPVDEFLQSGDQSVRKALDIIHTLHRLRNRQGVTATIHQLLGAARAHAGFALRPGGERVLANVTRVIDLARRFEMTTATSFRSFIEFLEDEAAAADASEAPLLEQDAKGVKLMTVHKAKGLEFPVVILADPTCRLFRPDEGRYVDVDAGLCAYRLLGCAPWDLLEHGEAENKAEREEADRIAYVAATRARDLLVVMALGIREWEEGWLSPLYDALYPPGGRTRCTRSYPGFRGQRTAFGMPQKAKAPPPSLMPGWHAPRRGSHEVLWFDPLLLPEEPPIFFGISNERLLQGDPSEGFAEYEAWRNARRQAIEEGSRPAWNIVTATGPIASCPVPEIEIETLEVAIAGFAVGSRTFGKLVHGVLHSISLDGGNDAIEELALAHARMLGLTPEHATTAAKAVHAVVSTPVFQRACGAQRVLREAPFILKTPGGTLVEGRIDLAFLDADGWTIVDYKTGRSHRQEYEDQLRLYALALAPGGKSVRGVLIQIGEATPQ
jgi:ATP-dependent exoDNAse (exonuclease V) beta subunit